MKHIMKEEQYRRFKMGNTHFINSIGFANKADSVTLSDIVNYESNDEVVSLTGDRKVQHNQLFGYKVNPSDDNSSNNNTEKQEPIYGKQAVGEVHFQNYNKKEKKDNELDDKEEMQVVNNRPIEIKRESDVVRMEESHARYSDISGTRSTNSKYNVTIHGDEKDSTIKSNKKQALTKFM
jgi:hypothetical protein